MPTALPPASDFTGSAVTEGDFKAAITAQRAFLAGLLGSTGDQASALAAIGAALNSSAVKTSAYTVVASDRGKMIICSGTGFTLSLSAAASLGDGFVFAVANFSSGAVTIDPNLSELIDGTSTAVLNSGKSAIIYCSGTEFFTVGKFNTGSGSGLDSDTVDGQHASAFASAGHNHSGVYVPVDAGGNGVGSIALCYVNTGFVNPYNTVSGSSLFGARIDSTSTIAHDSSTKSGTWRNLHSFTVSTSEVGIFQRIT